MDKETSKKMHTIMKRNKTYILCGIYEVLAALLINYSAKTCKVSIPALVFCLYVLVLVCMDYLKALEEVQEDKYKEKYIDDYNELVLLYNEYLDSITSIIKEYEYTDDLQLCLALDFLLTSGLFSLDNHFTYKEFEKNDEHYKNLLGSFIVTGNGVCRHITAFILDLLKRLDVNCFKITCINNKTKVYHAIVGIISNGEKYAYDFTNHFYGTLKGNYIYDISGKNKLYEIILLDMPLKEYKNIPIRNINYELIEKYSYGVDDNFFTLFRHINLFSLENSEIKKDISDKTLKLMPRK